MGRSTSVSSRRAYSFQLTMPVLGRRKTEMTRPQMRELLREIWGRESPNNRRMPDLIFQRGPTSYCTIHPNGRHQIVIIPRQQGRLILIHEVTHALHPRCKHGRVFVKRMIQLLERYAGMEAEPLLILARLTGIKITQSDFSSCLSPIPARPASSTRQRERCRPTTNQSASPTSTST